MATLVAIRALWMVAAIALADSGHGLTIGWHSGRSTLSLMHHPEHAASPHHEHGPGDRLLLVADDHQDHGPHLVSAVLIDDPGTVSRAGVAALNSIRDAGSVAGSLIGSSGISYQPARRPHPPPDRGPIAVDLLTTLLRTTILLI